MTAQKVVIVGGVAGGATTAARLRRLNEEMEIVLLERGEHISYANCGLPYYIGRSLKSTLALRSPASIMILCSGVGISLSEVMI